jgi:Kef-type K+ transport system membrane component KefB
LLEFGNLLGSISHAKRVKLPSFKRLGILMNTRGLMELIALNVGLELGVISQTLFTMMVLMALVTTVATTPILQLLTGSVVSHGPVNADLVQSSRPD